MVYRTGESLTITLPIVASKIDGSTVDDPGADAVSLRLSIVLVLSPGEKIEFSKQLFSIQKNNVHHIVAILHYERLMPMKLIYFYPCTVTPYSTRQTIHRPFLWKLTHTYTQWVFEFSPSILGNQKLFSEMFQWHIVQIDIAWLKKLFTK